MVKKDSRLEGYSVWKGVDRFEDYVGPLYYKTDADGTVRCAFIIDEKHVNGQNSVHGGMLMTFADYAVFVIAQDALQDKRAVTVSFTCDFTAGAKMGTFVESTGEIVHQTGGMVFMRGTVFSEESVLLRYSALLKKFREKHPGRA